jgi:hypothetical protein
MPNEVRDWISSVFREVNERTARKLSRIPTTHETSLDLTVIEQISQFSSPFRIASDWIVRIDTHYLGGGRHFGRWEIADLGILVVFRKGGIVQQTKIGLLQSKRLYPDELTVDAEDHEIDYIVGFGRLLHSDSEFRAATKDRTFHFSIESRYRALEFKGQQYDRVLEYQDEEKIPVHYMMYNPLQVPSTAVIPVAAGQQEMQRCDVGCRVVGASQLDVAMRSRRRKKGESPSFQDLVNASADLEHGAGGGWRFEHFVAHLLVGCKEGYRGGTDPMSDHGLWRVFGGRSAPIAASISITIDAPAV